METSSDEIFIDSNDTTDTVLRYKTNFLARMSWEKIIFSQLNHKSSVARMKNQSSSSSVPMKTNFGVWD